MFTRTVYGRKNGAYNYSEFICESEDDIAMLPTSKAKDGSDDVAYSACAIGSKAVIVDQRKIYILSPSDEWQFYCNVSNGGGGGTASVEVEDDGNGNVSIL